jgi:hypothetical protein
VGIEWAIRQKNVGEKKQDEFLYFFSHIFCLVFCTPKKIGAAICFYSDRSPFDHNREMMKQASLMYENIRRPRRDPIPASAIGAVFILMLEYVPSLSCQRARQLGGRFSLAGQSMVIC